MTIADLVSLAATAEKRWGPECEVSVDGLAVSGAVVLTSAPGLVLATSRTVSFSRPVEAQGQGYRAEAAALLAGGGP
jgi:hypothetical protein